MIEQYKESNITTQKEKTINGMTKFFSTIYKYVLKKIQEEDIIKNSLLITQGIFIKYSEEDQNIAEVKLFDAKESMVTAKILNPGIKFKTSQTLVLGYYQDYKTLMVLGIGEKKG